MKKPLLLTALGALTLLAGCASPYRYGYYGYNDGERYAPYGDGYNRNYDNYGYGYRGDSYGGGYASGGYAGRGGYGSGYVSGGNGSSNFGIGVNRRGRVSGYYSGTYR